MTELERLAALRAGGHLSEAEFAMRKTALLAPRTVTADNPPKRRALPWILGPIVILVLGAGAFLLARADGFQDALAHVPGGNSVTAMLGDDPPAAGPSASPPAEFMRRCVIGAQATVVRLVDTLGQMGRRTSWTQNRAGWVLDVAWHDPVRKFDRTLSIALDPAERTSLAFLTSGRDCAGEPGLVQISRIAVDGFELPSNTEEPTWVEVLTAIYDKDAAPPADHPNAPPPPTDESEAPPPATMNGGSTYGREAGGASNPDGSAREAYDPQPVRERP
ncbi:hypothetical protein ASE00_11740 [Sphingomonas sp. Root710]|uniref:SHOCT domain-containing protein n=1 Tax=Sphingomonas sp. Root710 TaxID=1736594 RepID=UPI0006FA2120|nr:SHOCT domain-containing protein [Sphingomonas sp. Root710]KRB82698.1 hypothetical protein ASE00_11740 [Sphingomonas sp. Root710]